MSQRDDTAGSERHGYGSGVGRFSWEAGASQPYYGPRSWNDPSSWQDPYGFSQRTHWREPSQYRPGGDYSDESAVSYERDARRDFGDERNRRYPPGPKGYRRSDERLKEDISERLMVAYHIDSSEVTVEVQGAKVTLDGTVPSRHMKHAIEDLVDGCPGVLDIDNRVRVASPNYQGSIPPTQDAGGG